jgi:Glycosyl hydrolases family 43/Concanavalin A-like lectin/glucanases superfamily
MKSCFSLPPAVQSGVWFLLYLMATSVLDASTNLRGSLGIHDPSAVIKCGDRYYVFGTGSGISSKSSADKIYWVTGPSVFASAPSWTTNITGFTGKNLWAPDITFFNGQYHLYYACSTFGSQVSGIGLATNPTLDPGDPAYHWTDQGEVIQSGGGVSYNCIDPSVTFDLSGNLWMSFGSFFSGIKLIQLDAATGLRNATNLVVTSIANDNAASGDPIEASYLYFHGNYFYLFVNWGTCCAGVNSTYNVRVGRSTSVTGPFLDRNNVNLTASGGTLFLRTTGKFIGPGQIGILEENGREYFGYHYYDANVNGTPTYDLEPLSWTTDGWPVFTNDWKAAYHFQMDARDDDGGFYGLLQNGATIFNDPLLGDVLILNGTNQFVKLPGGVANARSFAVVFKWNGGADWQHVFDFGRGANSYAFLTPSDATGNIRFTISASGTRFEEILEGTGGASTGTWTHAAVTTDGLRGILYVNGLAVATNASMTLTAPDIAPTNVWFGRSQFTTNAYFDGQISSVRIYGRALSADEIVAPQPVISAPLAGSSYQPGETIRFAGTATDFADVPLATGSLTWTVEFCDTNSTNIVAGPISGIGDGNYNIPSDGDEATIGYHRIILVATDTLGRAATNCVDIFPNPTNMDWTASYPFDNGAVDANGLFNGSLQSGASTSTDAVRGPVLDLSGASQYISLPADLGAMKTFSAWVNWNGGNAGQRIFDFGAGTTRYAMLTAKANNGRLRFEITPNGGGEARDLDSPGPLPVNVWTHVAVTLDGRQAVLFVNGQAVAVNSSVNLLPSDVLGPENFLGRSQSPANPYFSGQMDSVQISSQALPIEQITASSINISSTGSGLTLDWQAWSNGLGLYAASSLDANANWTSINDPPVITNGINFLTLMPTNSPTLFRLQFP